MDFDFPANRIRLYRPGDGAAAAEAAGLAELPAAVLNETGVLGIRATSPAAPALQPFVGILDCGASNSALNWRAAALAGLPPRGDAQYGSPGKATPGLAILGVDGKPQARALRWPRAVHPPPGLPLLLRPPRCSPPPRDALPPPHPRPVAQVLPIAPLQLTYAGEASKGPSGALAFDPPAPGWQPWEPVKAAVGELPVFAQLLAQDGKEFTGPAALIGLDVLAQRRVVIGAGVGLRGRARRLFVGKHS